MILGKPLRVVLLVLLAVTPCSAQPWDASALIVWKDESHRVALFVPAEMLLSENVSASTEEAFLQLPFDPETKKALSRAWAQAKQRSVAGPFQLRLPPGFEPSLLPGGSGLEWPWETLLEAPVVVLGRVVRTAPGLSAFGPMAVAQRVFIEVDERLVNVGSVATTPLSFLQTGGTLRLGQVELANGWNGDSSRTLKVGDRVLLSGWLYQGSTAFLMSSSTFRVDGEELNAVGFSSKVLASPLTLAEVRARLVGTSGAKP